MEVPSYYLNVSLNALKDQGIDDSTTLMVITPGLSANDEINAETSVLASQDDRERIKALRIPHQQGNIDVLAWDSSFSSLHTSDIFPADCKEGRLPIMAEDYIVTSRAKGLRDAALDIVCSVPSQHP